MSQSRLRLMRLVAVALVTALTVYLIIIPALLPNLWAGVKLPFAILCGEAVLLLGLVLWQASAAPTPRQTDSNQSRLGPPGGSQPAPADTHAEPADAPSADSPYGGQKPSMPAQPAMGQPRASGAERRVEVQQPAPADASVQVLQQQLRTMAHGDAALADRLVEFERSQRPYASESDLYQSAIERWQRDNR